MRSQFLKILSFNRNQLCETSASDENKKTFNVINHFTLWQNRNNAKKEHESFHQVDVFSIVCVMFLFQQM